MGELGKRGARPIRFSHTPIQFTVDYPDRPLDRLSTAAAAGALSTRGVSGAGASGAATRAGQPAVHPAATVPGAAAVPGGAAVDQALQRPRCSTWAGLGAQARLARAAWMPQLLA